MYTYKLNRFTFEYPSDVSVKEDVGGEGNVQYINLTSTHEEIKFEAGPLDYDGQFEHIKSTEIDVFNDIPWYLVPSSNYCDAGQCSNTAPGYYIKKTNYYVGVSELKETQS